jgi:Flp pilus assembly protein TadG
MKVIRRANVPTLKRGSAHSRSRSSARERGQVVVIFAGAVIALVALCAVVVDVAWYWTNNLRMQRAADAAALAGVVWLPSKPQTAYSVARAEAAKNGYRDGTGGVTITAVVDASNKQRLKVTITGPVGTFFARAVGINSFAAKRDAKADYVLPVPMGSPQNYYGVGFFEGLVPQTSKANAAGASSCGTASWSSTCTGSIPTVAPSGGQWTASSGTILASVQSNNNIYATENTNGQAQQWSTFGLLSGGSAIPSPAANQVLTIRGIEIRLSDAFVSAACASSTIGVDLSWDSGVSWSTAVKTPSLGTNTSTGDYALGSSSATSAWGSRAWGRNDFSDTSFRVRLTANKGCGTAGTTLNADMLEARVSWNVETTTTTWNKQTLSVPDPVSGTLASQGFWGAIFTSGGVRQNGDKYAPSYIGGGVTGVSSSSSSPTYDSAGYDYTIELPGAGNTGQVQLFDPIYCATGDNGHGGFFGAGDHWTTRGSTGTTDVAPVSITYRLYNTQGTLLDVTDDGLPVATLTYDPGGTKLADLSGYFGTPSGSGLTDCSTNPAHNKWVSMAAGLNAGIYRLNVNTSLAPANLNVGAENLFSIWVKSAGDARVYGGGRMAAYTNLDTGQQKFYFAQIEKTHAGKTMEIKLFDPGETTGNAYLRLLSPDGNSYHYQTFDWESDDGRSGTNVTEIQTSNGSPLFDNKEITITVPLPTTYGQGGINPPGDITDEDGWWLIEYQLSNGNDTTTWSVNIRGNPVHLVIP